MALGVVLELSSRIWISSQFLSLPPWKGKEGRLRAEEWMEIGNPYWKEGEREEGVVRVVADMQFIAVYLHNSQ